MQRGRQGLGTGQLKGIRRFEQDGIQYRYHRATGIRLPSDVSEQHPSFLKAYLAAEDQKGASTQPSKRPATPRKGTIAHAWWRFEKSEDFLDLSEGYRENIKRHGDAIIAVGGKVPVDQVRPQHIRKDMNDLNRNAQRMRLKAWRMFTKWLHSQGEIAEKWAAQVEMPSARKPQKHRKWDARHVTMFRNCWPIGTSQRLAMELMLFLGCRICDAVRIGPGMIIEGGWLRYTQKKTKGMVQVPFDRALPRFADKEAHCYLKQCLAALPARHMTWMTTDYGAARSEKAASTWFSKACQKAGLKDDERRTGHGLRSTCEVRMAEKGATTHQIGAWTGHESLSEIEGYTKEVNARTLLSADETGTQIVQVVKS